MTHPNADIPPPSGAWRSDYRFLTLAGLILAVLLFNILEHLILDTDHADMRYQRQFIDGSEINSPRPGDVYVYNHQSKRFMPSKACELQSFGTEELGVTEAKLTALNVWGDIVNATADAIGGLVGEKVTRIITVDRPMTEWAFVKHHRPRANAKMNPICLETVRQIVKDPSRTAFIVDTVFIDTLTSPTPKEWVSLAQPMMVDKSLCPDCPDPISIDKIIRADPFTRLKVDWHIVRIE